MRSLIAAMIAIIGLAALTPASADPICGPNMIVVQDHYGNFICVTPPPDVDWD
ncbi:hypothetical protein [Imbroritus primus]|uniref:hypothetical protein n=1 Tax=Imbroritus primus TaxID=3058603 RepID=UPI0002696D1B